MYMGSNQTGIINETGFAIDAELNSSIDDVKVQISLTYPEIDPSKIYLKFMGKKLSDDSTLTGINYQHGQRVEIYQSSGCCVVF